MVTRSTSLPICLLPLLPAVVGCSTNSSDSGYTDLCTTPLAPDEPLCSTAFGDTTWPGSHRSSYAQGSSPLAGPDADASVTSEHLQLEGAGIPVIMSFTAPYEDGGRAVWSTVLSVDNAIIKIDHETFELIDTYVPADREEKPPPFALGLSGAYTAIDAQNRFIAGRTTYVSFFGDSEEGDRFSDIELKKRIFMPPEVFCNEDDVIAGMSLTYDGHLAFATELGNLFVIPADADPDDLGEVPVISANQDCSTADRADLEIVSNSIASDEDGSIYMVTSAAMYRFDWDGAKLTRAWRAPYETVDQPCEIRLGPGSGSTPSVMGTAADDDRFVVITDGQELMHLVLFWRDEIPEGWEPIADGKDPRIACEVAIDFGDENATESCSEQSVAVRGYGAVVVNDLLRNPTINPPSNSPLAAYGQNFVSALEGGIPEKAPFGLQRVDWDPVTRECSVTWTNTEISVPNGIPSISEATGMVYGMGQRDGQWGLEGLDFETGESRVWAEGGPGTCKREFFDLANLLPGVRPILEMVPDSCENSMYAATTVGPDGMIYTGTLSGLSRYIPDSFEPLGANAQVEAGLDQGSDLLDRAEAGSSPSAISTRDYLRHAFVQLGATDEVAREAGLDDVSSAVQDAQRAVDAAVQALDAGEPTDDHIAEARAALDEAQAAL